MTWWLLLLIFITIIILLCAFLKINIKTTLQYARHHELVRVHIQLFFGLISYTYTLPKVKKDDELEVKPLEEDVQQENNETDEEHVLITMNRIVDHITNGYAILEQFLAHVSVHKVSWESTIGTGDAAATGTLTGLVWSLKGSIATLFDAHMKLQKRPHFTVVPAFQAAFVQTRFECIFSFRLGYAIGAGIKALKYIRKVKKQTSNEAKLLG